MKEAVIFDLDGTLWDPTGCACILWNRVLAKHSDVKILMTQEKVSGLMGKTMEEIGETLFPELSETQRMAIVDEYGDEEVKYLYENGAVLYDGLEETLKELRCRYELFIVSNSQDGYIPAFLHSHKLEDYFKDIEMSGRTGLSKGSNIKLIIERNGIDSAVYVGDTEWDEKAAGDAEIPFIWAKYGFGKALAPDGIIESVKQLPQILSALEKRH
ncbi:MAG: HAD family hydrolase [Eubacteriales bacterium]|nr:HAD family hydrolase [Eubacteriales bacterium]